MGFNKISSPPMNHSQKTIEDIVTKYNLLKTKLESTSESSLRDSSVDVEAAGGTPDTARATYTLSPAGTPVVTSQTAAAGQENKRASGDSASSGQFSELHRQIFFP